MSAVRKTKLVIAITLAGAAAGALAGVATGALLAVAYGGSQALVVPELYAFAGGLGATCGAVLGPAAAFGFMRRVPLGRLFAETTLGTIFGGLAGFLLGVGLVGVIGVAALGFFAAAARVARAHRGPGEPDSLPPAGSRIVAADERSMEPATPQW